jgi:hypothetical protein
MSWPISGIAPREYRTHALFGPLRNVAHGELRNVALRRATCAMPSSRDVTRSNDVHGNAPREIIGPCAWHRSCYRMTSMKSKSKVSKSTKKPLTLEKETVKALNVKTGVQAGCNIFFSVPTIWRV